MIECISNIGKMCIEYAGMAELADALDSGSNGRKAVQVQVLLPAPRSQSYGWDLFHCSDFLPGNRALSEPDCFARSTGISISFVDAQKDCRNIFSFSIAAKFAAIFCSFSSFSRCNMNFFNLSFPRPLWKDSFTIFLDKSKKAFIIKINNYY